MKLKILIISVITLLYGCDKGQNLYQCPNQYSSDSCNKECKKIDNVRYEFNLNKEKSNVLLKIYLENELNTSNI
jgi:hypothetical protein